MPATISGNQNITFGDSTIQSTAYAPRTIRKITKGHSSFHALTSDNKVYGWGYNGYGQIGDGTTNNAILTEVLFPNYNTTSTIVDMCTFGMSSEYVLFSDGNLYAWGYNGYGNLGVGHTTQKNQPVLTLTGVSQLYYPDNHRDYTGANSPEIYIYIKKTDGTFWCCGYNGHGALANGTLTNSSTWIPLTPPTGKTISNLWIGSGTGGSSFCKTTDNLIYAVGYNTQGQLGIGNVTQQNSWVQVPYFNTISDVIDIQTGGYYFDGTNGGDYMWTAALTASGKIHTCGNNAYGQLGNGTVTTRSTFAQVTLITPVRKMIRGSTSIYVIFTDNTYARWGENSYGQLGTGTTTNASTPVMSSIFMTAALDIFNCSRGGYWPHHSEVFIKTPIGIYVAGYNASGSLGFPTLGNTSNLQLININENPADLVDVLITGGNNVSACLFFKNSDKVYVAGYNGEYQSGTAPNFGDKYTFRPLSFP